MKSTSLGAAQIGRLRSYFGDSLRENVPLAPLTSSRVGGPADFMLEVRSIQELSAAARRLWALGIPFRLLGGGSNLLISDRGIREVVLLNRARSVAFEEATDHPRVWSESGAAMGTVARRAVERGLAGLEWAAAIPGTVGGAVVGNSGAHGCQISQSLDMAEILQPDRDAEPWRSDRLDYGYRSSWLKRNPGRAVVLSATFRLERSGVQDTRGKLAEFMAYRQQTQPSGASWGSIFKNPPGDYAGRLIEAAGLKGLREGNIAISEQHANFFINLGEAKARDAWELIQRVQKSVSEKFGIRLELEIEIVGDWEKGPGEIE